ncbi:MAG: transposase [Okeania sp. SIO2D1]|nr:transposase [Okeania sp. SIO2D1]
MGTTRTFATETSRIEGHAPNANLTEVVNCIFYILYSGCHWRSLPHDLPPWQTVSTKCR